MARSAGPWWTRLDPHSLLKIGWSSANGQLLADVVVGRQPVGCRYDADRLH